MSHCKYCTNPESLGEYLCPGCGHEERIATLERQLADQEQRFVAHSCALDKICRERDAAVGKLAEAQAKLVEWNARFERQFGEACKTITKMAAERDALKALLIRLSPTLANDPRHYTTEEQIAVVEQEYHALVVDHAELESTLEQAREALEAWQIRLAFVGHPNEPKDWSKPVSLTEKALAALGGE